MLERRLFLKKNIFNPVPNHVTISFIFSEPKFSVFLRQIFMAHFMPTSFDNLVAKLEYITKKNCYGQGNKRIVHNCEQLWHKGNRNRFFWPVFKTFFRHALTLRRMKLQL